MSIYGDSIFLNEDNYRSDNKKVKEFHRSMNKFNNKMKSTGKDSAAGSRLTSCFREYLNKHDIHASVRADMHSNGGNTIHGKIYIEPFRNTDNAKQTENKLKEVLSKTGEISSYLNANIREHRVTCNGVNTSSSPFSLNVSMY